MVVDTGAAVSILPVKYSKGLVLSPTPVKLLSASGQTISCHGQCLIDVHIPELRRTFSWKFVIAETVHCLLGLDFLSHHNLIVDCKRRKLWDTITGSSATAAISSVYERIYVVTAVDQPKIIKNLLKQFPNLITPELVANNSAKTKVYHRIETKNGRPTFAKARQLSPEKFDIARNEFTKLVKTGIAKQSNSQWSSPLHMVPKSTQDSGGRVETIDR